MTEKPIKKMLSAAKIVQGERNFRASECNQVYLNCRAQPKMSGNKVYFNCRAAAYLLQISLKFG